MKFNFRKLKKILTKKLSGYYSDMSVAYVVIESVAYFYDEEDNTDKDYYLEIKGCLGRYYEEGHDLNEEATFRVIADKEDSLEFIAGKIMNAAFE